MSKTTTLTAEEHTELAQRIADGDISRSCKQAKVDWFNVRLSSGKRAVGAYAWDSGNDDFLRLTVYEK